MTSKPSKKRTKPQPESLQAQVRRLQEIGDRNSKIFVDALTALEVRNLALQAVINDLVAQNLRLLQLPAGAENVEPRIDWNHYLDQQEKKYLPQPEVELEPELESSEEEAYPAGATIFGGT